MTAIAHPIDLHPPLAHARHPAHEAGHHERISFFKRYLFSTDHKTIGLQFLFVGLMFFVIGGLLAMVVRWQLAWPDGSKPLPILSSYMNWKVDADGSIKMPPDFYAQTFTMHASIMIFFVVIPLLVGTFGNYLIPLKIGAPDMAFPFLNGVAFWMAIPAGALLTSAFFLPGGPPISGWTAYPTLSELPLTARTLGFDTVAGAWGSAMMFLRIHDPVARTMGNWSDAGLVMNFAALFLCYSYICAYTVRTGVRAVNYFLSFLLCFAASVVTLKAFQHAVFDGQSAWFLSIFILGFSSILGAVNYLTTVIKLRCPGMTMFRLPLSVWSLFITSILVLLATPVLAATLFMNLLDHHQLTTFFVPFNWLGNSELHPDIAGGGYPLLHQHLFWFYSHPAVYIMILPGMGIVSDILATFSRKPVFGYRPMIYALAGIAFLGFIVWAHHMFQSGMNPTLGTTFAVSTTFIAVPSAIKTFNWLGTLWGGNIKFTTPMLHAISFVAMFVVGGLSGIFMASTAVDVHIHDTYFIVAHIHYVLFGGSTFAIFAGITYYYPKMFGRMMNEPIGKLHWLLTFIFFNGTFFPMHILGLGGMDRRLYDYTVYPTFAHFLDMNRFITYCAFGMGAAQLLIIVNFIGSWVWGKRAGRNPWLATTLEWETASPPPHGNFEQTPVVHHGPYEYSSPLVEEDWLAQTRVVETAPAFAAVTGGH